MLVGLRGVGKTVLLNRIVSQAEELSLHAVQIEDPEGKSLSLVLLPELKRLHQTLDRMAAASAAVRIASIADIAIIGLILAASCPQ